MNEIEVDFKISDSGKSNTEFIYTTKIILISEHPNLKLILDRAFKNLHHYLGSSESMTHGMRNAVLMSIELPSMTINTSRLPYSLIYSISGQTTTSTLGLRRFLRDLEIGEMPIERGIPQFQKKKKMSVKFIWNSI